MIMEVSSWEKIKLLLVHAAQKKLSIVTKTTKRPCFLLMKVL